MKAEWHQPGFQRLQHRSDPKCTRHWVVFMLLDKANTQLPWLHGI
jgi:hypothetical protein